MKLLMFSIEDVKAGTFSPPICVPAVVHARRMFTELVSDKAQVQARYPNDFRLVQIGEFDEKTGSMTEIAEFVVHGFGTDFVEVPRGDS